MRILFDSKNPMHKNPFGPLLPKESCALHIHIPSEIRPTAAECLLHREDGSFLRAIPLTLQDIQGAYDIFAGQFSMDTPGLYFYYFRITAQSGAFRLFKQGDDTNMEAGDSWQLSCVPAEHTVPDWAKGAVIYQVFPDRFHRSGQCDLTGKLEPYTIHEAWDEEVVWQPDSQGRVLNNDFFGGNFRGILEKLDYIASLGATILYLNPISKSFSSHRYDTGDYKTPDPMLGTEADFVALCEAAHARGIRVILDGVFSHTGSNSLYFDKERTFGGQGAYCGQHSPYYNWYTFYRHPDVYKSWWGFDTLPTVQKMEPSFLEYIITGEDSVVAHWLRLGADGFRLDVVDELPDAFVLLLKRRIRELKPDALLIGEVWEDASNKVSYDIRRRYFVDGELDSCMNYPFRTAILNFATGWDDGSALKQTVMTILENYPPQVLLCNMNMLGTHDTPRILTALVDSFDGSREALAQRRLSEFQRSLARQRLLLASFLQYMLPGAPSLYYGDEAGMEGYKDPFNRRPYPWGREDKELLSHYQSLGQLRKQEEVLRTGSLEFFLAGGGRLGFSRKLGTRRLRIYVNRSEEPWRIPPGAVLYGHLTSPEPPQWLSIAPMGFCITDSAIN